MSPDPASIGPALEKVCTEFIAPKAASVDREGAFPERGLNALAEAGLMAAVSAPEVGGLGLGVRGAATIVGRLAQDCGSTAMVVCARPDRAVTSRPSAAPHVPMARSRSTRARLGFSEREAAELSALHTRNFM